MTISELLKQELIDCGNYINCQEEGTAFSIESSDCNFKVVIDTAAVLNLDVPHAQTCGGYTLQGIDTNDNEQFASFKVVTLPELWLALATIRTVYLSEFY